MPRSEAKKAADKRHKEKLVRWSADLYPEDANAINEIRKRHGLSCRNFLLDGAERLRFERDTVPYIKKKYAQCNTFREVRKLSGLTQAMFSELLHIPIGTVQAWDTEKREISPYQLELIKYFLANEGVINEKKTEE